MIQLRTYVVLFVTWNADCYLHCFFTGLIAFLNAKKTPLPIHGHPDDHRLLKKENINIIIYKYWCNFEVANTYFLLESCAVTSAFLANKLFPIAYLHAFGLLEMMDQKANQLVGENRIWRSAIYRPPSEQFAGGYRNSWGPYGIHVSL